MIRKGIKATMFRSVALFGLISAASMLTACGGGADSSTSALSIATLATGRFVDSPVEGLRYTSGGQAGYTNANGEFTYEVGQNVTFYVGNISFSSTGGDQITPLTIFETTDFNDTRVVNLARLLQTLDDDGVASNGITITDAAHTAAVGLTVDFSSPTFATEVNTLVANGGGSASLVSAQDAVSHMQSQLSIVGTWYIGSTSQPDNLAILTFFNDGTYMMSEDGDVAQGGGGGVDGMERGTYTWDPNTGAFMATSAVDTNGDWGLSHPQGSTTVQINGNSMTINDSVNGVSPTRVTNSSDSVVGSWYGGSTSEPNALFILTFFDDGTYMMSEDGDAQGGLDGMERGTYTWNTNTGAFTATPIVDTNGDWGLSHPQGSTTVQINGNSMTINDSVAGASLTRILP